MERIDERKIDDVIDLGLGLEDNLIEYYKMVGSNILQFKSLADLYYIKSVLGEALYLTNTLINAKFDKDSKM